MVGGLEVECLEFLTTILLHTQLQPYYTPNYKSRHFKQQTVSLSASAGYFDGTTAHIESFTKTLKAKRREAEYLNGPFVDDFMSLGEKKDFWDRLIEPVKVWYC